MPRTTCPTPEDLAAYLAGTLPDEAFAACEAHLDAGCPRCEEAIAELQRREDPLVGLLRRHPPPFLLDAGGLVDGMTAAGDEPGGGARLPPAEYEVLSLLGTGGMGVVYKAREIAADRIVAVKMIRTDRPTTGEEQRRFRAETEAVAKLNHPHIVHLYHIGEWVGAPYFVMEFAEGGNLAAPLRERTLPAREAASLVEKLARAVAYAHSRGIIHRDLKPANVLLTATNEPKIADFGLAKQLENESSSTQTGAVMGTGSYMAPEQAAGRGREIGPWSDVWALGALLYECLTGRPPFKGETVLETLEQVRTLEPLAPSRLQPKTPRDLETICLKCLRKRPEDRYGTADALAEDLGRFLGGRPVLARPATARERAWKWAKRHPARAASAAALVLGLAAVSWLTANWLAARTAAREREVTSRQYAYYNSGSLADRAWLAGDTEQADALLNECPAEFRRFWEWNHQKRRIHSELRSFASPSGRRQRVAYSSDGRLLATAEGDGGIRLWEPDGGQLVRALTGHADVFCVSFSRDASLLVSTAEDGTIKVWDVATGRLLWQALAHRGRAWAAVFSPDGRRVATAGEDRTVRFWDAASGTPISTPLRHSLPVRGLAFSPDGTALFAAGGDPAAGELRAWEGTDGRELSAPKTYPTALTCVCVSPDGSRVAVGSAVRDPRIGESSLIQVYDGRADRGLRDLRAWTTGVTSVAFAGDSRSLVAGGGRTVQVWDTDTGKETARLCIPPWSGYMAVSPDGRRVATDCSSGAKLWDLTSPQGCRTFRGHTRGVNAVAFSPDGRSVATAGADETVIVQDATDGRNPWTARHPGKWKGVIAVAFSPDGRTLASASRDAAVRVWDVTTRREVRRLPHADATGVAFSPAGRRLATAAFDGGVKIWDADTGSEALSIRAADGPVWGVGFSPDGSHLAAAGMDRQMVVWDAGTGRRVATMSGHESEVTALAYSPTRPVIATAGFDRTVRLWDAGTGRELHKLQGHTLKVTAVAFSPDGDRVASTSDDGTVRLWDPASGREVLTVIGHRGGTTGVGFSPDGAWLASAGWDGTVRLWDGRPSGSESR